MREYTKIYINEKAERSAKAGHPWIYGEEVTEIFGDYQNGDIVDVYTRKDKFIGSGFINDNSKILVRIFSRNANDTFDEKFWERRIRYAIEHRKTVFVPKNQSCARLIFGDSDGFPGLIVDRFENILVLQIMSLGIELRREMLISLLLKVTNEFDMGITAVYERSDVAVREKEGLEQRKGFLYGEGNGEVIITENELKFAVDYINGQKTGYFLDQKLNRLAVSKISYKKKVLDCFTHTGAFALNAAKGGAVSVTAVDISMDALRQAEKNAEMNGIENIEFVCGDVFDYLGSDEVKTADYDFIILDPPAFTKSTSTVTSAYRGYKEINLRAMKLLPRGGYLATCSCSHFMTDDLFRKMIIDAAADAGVQLLEVENRRQSPDHPILWGIPETEYLKFYIFRVI